MSTEYNHVHWLEAALGLSPGSQRWDPLERRYGRVFEGVLQCSENHVNGNPDILGAVPKGVDVPDMILLSGELKDPLSMYIVALHEQEHLTNREHWITGRDGRSQNWEDEAWGHVLEVLWTALGYKQALEVIECFRARTMPELNQPAIALKFLQSSEDRFKIVGAKMVEFLEAKHGNKPSLNDKIERIRRAFEELGAMGQPAAGEAARPWVSDVYDDGIIIEAAGSRFFVSYSEDKDGKITFAPFAQWKKVEKTWAEIKENELGYLREQMGRVEQMIKNFGRV